MTVTRIIDLEVGYDYGQLNLTVHGGGDDDYSEIVDTAIGNDGIAQGESTLVVLSPSQCNFTMRLSVETAGSGDADDLDDWQEGFEALVEIGPDAALWYGSAPDGPEEELPVPVGRYRVLITGRGFTQRGYDPDPHDEWRLRFTPATDSISPRRLKAWGPTET